MAKSYSYAPGTPDGTGKGTVLNKLRENYDNIRYSVSATTRKPREGEVEGINYFFKTIDEFKKMVNGNEFIEWVEYCENLYGTPRKYVEETLSKGHDVVLEIEVDGALNIKKQFPECVTVFMVPPSFEQLVERIVGRGTEKPEVIEKRMAKAKQELDFIKNYDYITVNNDILDTAWDLISIIKAEKLKYSRNKNILMEIGVKEGGEYK